MLRWLAVLLLMIGYSATAVAQSDLSRSRLVISPFGISDQHGVDAFGETLLSPQDRHKLAYWLYQQETISEIAEQQSSENLTDHHGTWRQNPRK